MEQLGNRIDRQRIHLFGRIPHEELQKLTGATLHVYLQSIRTQLSLLEVMASGTPVLAEANPMMEELIEPGVMNSLAGRSCKPRRVIAELINSPKAAAVGRTGSRASKTSYLQRNCLDELEGLLHSHAASFDAASPELFNKHAGQNKVTDGDWRTCWASCLRELGLR